MASENSSPTPIQSAPSSSVGERRYNETASISTSSPPSAGSGDGHHSNRTRQHRHHSKEREDRSRSPHRRPSSRYDERYERRSENTSMAYSQDLDHPTRTSRRRDHRDDDYRYNSNRDGNRSDRYRPSSLTAAEDAPPTTSRIQERYQPRYEESRYDTRGRRDDYQTSYDRSHYYPQHQSQSRDHRSHYPSPSHHHHHHHHHAPPNRQEPHYRQHYDDGRYQRHEDRPYETRSRPSRRTVDRGTDEERQRSKILFVGNLPYDHREPEVAAMFERYGKLVKITIPMDAVTTKNKGFAFVEFEQRHDAEQAMENYNGFSVEGRRLKLDWDIGLNKKDVRRAPPSEDYGSNNHRRNRSPPPSSSSSSPPMRRGPDTYIPSADEGSSRRNMVAETYRS